MSESLQDRTVLVTGANGGLGAEFVGQALARGARRVYATARRPRDWNDERIVPLTLDLNSAASVAQAAAAASDVDLLINNAALAPVEDRSLATADDTVNRQIFDTNYFGTLRVAQAFAPILAANGGGAMLNVLSLAAWTPMPTTYAASKAAMWSATNGLRLELSGQQTTVTGLIVGMIDTAMSSHFDVPKISPAAVVQQGYDAVLAGVNEVLADDDSRRVHAALSTGRNDFDAFLYQAMAEVGVG